MTTNLLSTVRRPHGGFRTILADPPWPFDTYSRGQKLFTSSDVQPYAVMPIADMKQMPVRQLAGVDCLLHMWILDAQLPAALELAAAWGFAYKTRGFVWNKGSMGGGKYTRKCCEISLIFTRGAPKVTDHGVRDLITAPRREHSRKPDEQYGEIERLSAGPYLELFARNEPRLGWTKWGNQVGRFAEAG